VHVVLIEPGSIKTQFHTTAEAHAQDIFSNPGSPYQPLYEQYEKVGAGMRRGELGPEAVCAVVQQAIEAAKPKARYLVGLGFSGRLLLHLSDPVWDLALRRMFKIRGPV
jgi:hypothetical protein